MLRERIKSTCETVLARGGAAGIYRTLAPSRGFILAYHNVVPDSHTGIGDRSLHLPMRYFREQLDHLMEWYDVVPLDALLDGAPPPGGRPKVAITFDDAYRGAVTLGVEEIRKRRLSATIFISPTFLGDKSFWWDLLGAGRDGVVDPAVRAHALDELQGDHARITEWAREQEMPLGEMSHIARCATEEEVLGAVRRPGITLGPHGWSHRNLTRLSSRDLEEELVRPLEWLQRRFPSVIPWLSYPYGLADRNVERACMRTGYRAGLRIGTGILPSHSGNRFGFPRVSVPSGISLDGFVLRTVGLVAG